MINTAKIINVSPETLVKWHWDEKLTMAKIAKRLKCSVGKVCNVFKELNIIARKSGHRVGDYHISEAHKKKLSEIHTGKIITEETRRKMSDSSRTVTGCNKIGFKKKRSDGYIAVFYPDHPCSNKDGIVMEHRLVMEEKIGRILTKEETVHHKNGKRDDNDPDNLELFANTSEHQRYHALYTRKRNKRGFAS